jgi:ABC-type lipoprotein release transport system permease subunit
VKRTEAAIPFFLVGRLLRRGSRWTLALTVLLLAAAFVNLVFVASLFDGIVQGSNAQVVNAYVGHVTVSAPEGQRALEHVDDTLSKILHTPGVVGASAQTMVPATLQYGNIVVAREVLAIDPQRERTVTNIADKMIAGSFLQPDDTNGIVIGNQIAGGPDVELNGTSFRGARVGQTVQLSLGGVTRPFVLRGIFRTKFLTADLRAFITRRALDAMEPAAHDRATSVIVRAPHTGQEPALIEALRAQGVVGTFGTWEDNAGIMRSVTKSFASIDAMLSVVGLLIAAVTIFIVITIDVTNRRQQIGVLRALGIKSWIIRLTYMLRSAVYAVAGVALGIAIFLGVLVPYFKAHPISLPICDAVLAVDTGDMVRRASAIVAVAIISGLIPALLATRMGILDEISER